MLMNKITNEGFEGKSLNGNESDIEANAKNETLKKELKMNNVNKNGLSNSELQERERVLNEYTQCFSEYVWYLRRDLSNAPEKATNWINFLNERINAAGNIYGELCLDRMYIREELGKRQLS
jgi:hypothetical protein